LPELNVFYLTYSTIYKKGLNEVSPGFSAIATAAARANWFPSPLIKFSKEYRGLNKSQIAVFLQSRNFPETLQRLIQPVLLLG